MIFRPSIHVDLQYWLLVISEDDSLIVNTFYAVTFAVIHKLNLVL